MLKDHFDVLPNVIQIWLHNLKRLNINILDIHFENLIGIESRTFQTENLNKLWDQIKNQLSVEKPVIIHRVEQNYLIGYLLTNTTASSVISLYIAPQINDSTLEIIRTSMGWIFYEQQSKKVEHLIRTENLLEIFAYVNNQTQFRIAAQEWINQTTTYIRNHFASYENIHLNYFLVESNKKLQWIVSSELSWTEKGTASMQKMNEIALETLFLQHELYKEHWYGYPIFFQGKVQAILIASDRSFEQNVIASHLHLYIRNNIELIHPLLQYWHQSEKNLGQHCLKSIHNLFHKYKSNGHYTWKIVSAIIITFFLIITLVPVDKLVTANLNVEGKTRWIISAPSQGFVEKVMVRPGDEVKITQPLLQLDNTDLKLQLAEQQSLLDQAQHQFRVAMSEENLTDSGLASNQIRQQETKIQTLERKINQNNITAPITGKIIDGDWSQQIGTPVDSGKELFQIASQDAYKVILHVADKDIHLIEKNQNGVLRLTGLPDQTFPIKITQIMPIASVDNSVNGFKVEAAWVDSPPALTPGMQGIGKITVGQTNLLLRWSRDFINWIKLKIWSNW